MKIKSAVGTLQICAGEIQPSASSTPGALSAKTKTTGQFNQEPVCGQEVLLIQQPVGPQLIFEAKTPGPEGVGLVTTRLTELAAAKLESTSRLARTPRIRFFMFSPPPCTDSATRRLRMRITSHLLQISDKPQPQSRRCEFQRGSSRRIQGRGMRWLASGRSGCCAPSRERRGSWDRTGCLGIRVDHQSLVEKLHL